MKTRLAVAVALLGVLGVSNARGADIALTPGDITMTLSSGQSKPTEVKATLNNPPTTSFSITFQLRPFTGGTLPAAWLKTQPAVVSNGNTSVSVPLEVSVPATAKPGSYSTTLRPVASNFPLAPSVKPLFVSLVVAEGCASAPTVSIASSAPADFGPPNNKVQNLVLTGSIAVPAGCALGRAWYVLEDEYGLVGGSGDVVVVAGSFTLSVPLTISRRGDDKDGRTYRVTVSAEDEAGAAAGATQVVTIGHDQRGGK
jgi:hypothetical protein